MKKSRSSINWLESARGCQACPLFGYQAPPVVFLGPIWAPVLILGQNPGRIKHTDVDRLNLAKSMWQENDPEKYQAMYWEDFTSSYGYKRLSTLFGEDWLSTNRYCYSNVVLCRTRDNAAPPPESIDRCWTVNIEPLVELWLRSGKKKKAAVLMGGIAGSWKVEFDRIGVPALHIPHYATWSLSSFTEVTKKWYQFSAQNLM